MNAKEPVINEKLIKKHLIAIEVVIMNPKVTSEKAGLKGAGSAMGSVQLQLQQQLIKRQGKLVFVLLKLTLATKINLNI